jgi:enamine deaminase RidA (YjgF/YER057c/UK114 family)
VAVKKHNPADLFPQYNNYSHAIEVTGDSRILFISGLNGYEADGVAMPESFADQARLIWTYIGSILESAGMGYENIVSLRTYLAHPDYDEPNIAMRKEFLGNNAPASTVICCQLLETGWKLEIEAVAAT